MDDEMAGQLAGGLHGIVGNDDIGSAVVEDAYDGAVVHGPPCQVAHALARTLAIDIAALQRRQGDAYLLDLADGGQTVHVVVGIFGDVDCDVSSVALGPPVLPQVTSHLCDLVDLSLQRRTSF